MNARVREEEDMNDGRLDGFGWLFLVVGGVSIVNAVWMLVGPMQW